MISAPVLDTLKEQGCRELITLAISKECFSTIGSIFIDDTDLVEGKLSRGSTIIEEVANSLQKSINS